MYLTASELTTSLRSRMRDPSGVGERWSDAEIFDAVNAGIAEFETHVGFYTSLLVPLDAAGLYQPLSYMQNQVLFYADGVLVNTQTKPGDTVTATWIVEAWVYNYPLPDDTYTLTAGLVDEDSAVTVTAASGEIPPIVGHFKIGLEVIRYNGVTSAGGSDYTLTNVERNANGVGVLAASISSPASPAIYMDDSRLNMVLMDKAATYLHSLFPTNSSPTEVQHHQWMMRWHTQQVTNFWRSYTPNTTNVRRPMRKGY